MRMPLIAATAFVLVAATSARAEIVVPVLDSSAYTNAYSNGTPDKLTDSSGLSVAVNTGDTLAQAQSATHVWDGGFAQSWVTNGGGDGGKGRSKLIELSSRAV